VLACDENAKAGSLQVFHMAELLPWDFGLLSIVLEGELLDGLGGVEVVFWVPYFWTWWA
jgi:hypothetical protein